MKPSHLEIFALVFILPTGAGMTARWVADGWRGDTSPTLMLVAGGCLIAAALWRHQRRRRQMTAGDKMEGVVEAVSPIDDGREEFFVKCENGSITLKAKAGAYSIGDRLRMRQWIEPA